MANTAIKHLLILETGSTGHSPTYIQLLHSYLLDNRLPFKVTFAVSPALEKNIKLEDNIQLSSIADRVDIVFLEENEIPDRFSKPWKQAMARWGLMKKYLNISGADHGHFLNLDHLQLPLALGYTLSSNQTISGLLFRPSIHEPYRTTIRLSIKDRLLMLRKRFLYSRMLKNPCLRFIFTLDQCFPAFADKTFKNGNRVYHLPDPSLYDENTAAMTNEDQWINTIEIRPKQTCFLLFGFLTERKGIFVALQALEHLAPEDSTRITIIFAGKFSEEVRESFVSKINNYREHHKNGAHIHYEDRYLPSSNFAHLLNKCDFVLAPYQRFTGSSGVLLWAAGAKKPVITQNHGLLGYLTNEYHLGIATNTTDAKQLAASLKKCLDNPSQYKSDTSGMEKLHLMSSPKNFVETFYTGFMEL